ncbi:MAG: hypothetical protein HPY66_2701 [Firmicutes bacterium]|nr:hypothetical protein [Bacillota bacterium]
MTIRIEQVDLIMQRANVGYAEAKDALEKCNGSMVDALVYLEGQNKVKPNKKKECEHKFIDGTMNLIRKGNRTKFIIRKREKDVLNIPVNVAIIAGLLAAPVAAAGIVLALLTSHRIRIEKEDGAGVQANEIFDKVSSAVESARDSITSSMGSSREGAGTDPTNGPAAE